jgi:DNA adenine methylase
MTDGQHIKMAELAHQLKGKVIISGYKCELYDELFGAWRRIDIGARAVNNTRRIESIWVSPNCAGPIQRSLF